MILVESVQLANRLVVEVPFVHESVQPDSPPGTPYHSRTYVPIRLLSQTRNT
jgi:hypothetical protein